MWRTVLAIVVLACATRGALADEPDTRARARALVHEGNDKLDEGRFLEALDHFERAYQLFPSPRLHFNIAQTLSELGRPVEALEHYERYVREVKEEEARPPENWRIAHQQIFRLEGVVARVEIQASVAGAEVSIDGKPLGKTPLGAPVRLMPGSHAIVVSRPGYERHVVERTLEAGKTAVERVELRPEAEAPARRAAQAEERLRRAEEESRRGRERTRTAMRATGRVALYAGALSVVTAGVLAALASNAFGNVEAVGSGTSWTSVRDDYQRASSLRTAAIVTGVVGGALIAGGVLLHLAVPDVAEGRVALAPLLAPGAAGLVVAGGF